MHLLEMAVKNLERDYSHLLKECENTQIKKQIKLNYSIQKIAKKLKKRKKTI